VAKGASFESIAWVPDGSGIVRSGYAFGSSLSREIWLVSYPGGKVRRITSDLCDYTQLTVSSGEEAIAAVRRERLSNLWMVDAAIVPGRPSTPAPPRPITRSGNAELAAPFGHDRQRRRRLRDPRRVPGTHVHRGARRRAEASDGRKESTASFMSFAAVSSVATRPMAGARSGAGLDGTGALADAGLDGRGRCDRDGSVLVVLRADGVSGGWYRERRRAAKPRWPPPRRKTRPLSPDGSRTSSDAPRRVTGPSTCASDRAHGGRASDRGPCRSDDK
jgi:hypothetical protein